MLFSEPKIPQFLQLFEIGFASTAFQCSSASRKFLNRLNERQRRLAHVFQCSSASRKFLNARALLRRALADRGFSALQRAENSSMGVITSRYIAVFKFQCSSASRKFLNLGEIAVFRVEQPGFSALQRAENSSIFLPLLTRRLLRVSVLFSEPKIPQLASPSCGADCGCCFSALQRAENSSMVAGADWRADVRRFSALQRAENSSIMDGCRMSTRIFRFQCSSASRKFLNVLDLRRVRLQCVRFSALQRAENSSMP